MVILNHKISQQYALKTKIGCLTENKSINQYFKYLILCILITFILSSQYIFSIINYYQIKKQVQLICNEKVYFLNFRGLLLLLFLDYACCTSSA